MENRFGKFSDVVLVLVLGAQGGLMLALPALASIALGYWLDMRYDSLPWITLGLTIIGVVTGPILLHRYMKTVVKKRMREQEDDQEEKPE